MYGIEWDICYVSDMPRALVTAKDLYEGKPVIDKLLRRLIMHHLLILSVLNFPFSMAYLW